ncbi:tRNA wybutosine-synthesizing protein like [Quillaja saponaria]|uniref:tRNA wybutosine-synthesizing protein like n=1 Tax=Quillaja saponaria TaxID=32244 RepID=A0AAD7PB05_QUISA|nr:tRNA wybutosine-synthesizing protein like [Quillaja saponaria]
MASSVVSESFFKGIEFSEVNNVLLMSLMEETQEDDDQYFGDDHRLVSLIQSLEAEINGPAAELGFINGCDYQMFDLVQVDGRDCSTSLGADDHYGWVDEVNAWNTYGVDHEDLDVTMEYYDGVLFEQNYSDSYLQEYYDSAM